VSRRKLRTVVALGATVFALSATSCGGKDDTAKPPASPTVASSTPAPSTPANSPTPAPTPPAAATGITVTSADAFARFYLSAIDHAAATGDVSALRTWADKGCISCNKLIKYYASVYSSGGSVSGNVRTTNAKATSAQLNGTKAANVMLQFTEARHTIIPSKGAKPTVFPGGTSVWRMALLNQGGHWIMYEMKEQ
jgi:hypothetical protein